MGKRLSLLLLAVVAAIGTVAAGAGLTSEPLPSKAVLACSECHAMEKEVDQWAASVHSDLTCLACHMEGDVTWVRHEFLERNEDMATHAGEHKTIKLKADLDRCETCHEPQMARVKYDLIPGRLTADGRTVPTADTGKPMDVRVMHSLHINDQQLECVSCHLNAVHGPAPGTTERRDDAHNLCLDCHEQKAVKIEVEGDVSCTACHLDVAKITPADHKNAAAWKRNHGTASATQSCGDCHLSASAGPQGRLANPAFFPTASRGDECISCHGGMAMPHPESFLARHGKEALTAQPGTCQICHTTEPDAAATSAHTGAQSCSECHLKPMPHPDGYLAVHGKEALQDPAVCVACHSSQNPANPTALHAQPSYCSDCHAKPMPHPKSFMAVHGAEALQDPATCAECHSSQNSVNPTAMHASKTYCGTCHDAYQHPQGWVAGHGTQVQDSCATCHSMKEEQGTHNACAACHTSEGIWHEKMWFAKHGRVVEAQGEDSCMTCHSEVEPSCSKCHAAR